MTAVPLPPQPTPEADLDGVWVLCAEDHEQAAPFAEQLRTAGALVRVTCHGEAHDWDNADTAAAWFGANDVAAGRLRGLCLLHDRRMDAEPARWPLIWQGLRRDFHLVQGFLKYADPRDGVTVVGLAGDGSVFQTLPAVAPAPLSGRFGLLRALALELPAVRVRLLDVAPTAPAAATAAWLVDAIGNEGPTEIGYRDGVAYTTAPKPMPPGPTKAYCPQPRILISGGARGITAYCATELAALPGARLVILGRTDLTDFDADDAFRHIEDPLELKRQLLARAQAAGDTATPAAIDARWRRCLKQREIHGHLAAMRRAGAAVVYHACDINDGAALNAVLDRETANGAFDYVLHGAGIVEDKLLKDKTTASFERVCRTKILGALNLLNHKATASATCVALFGSVSGRFGNRAQADYAAANDILNQLAHRANGSRAGRVCCLQWGPWQSISPVSGMVAPGLADIFRGMGVNLIDVADGAAALMTELAQTDDKAEVVLGDWLSAATETNAREVVG